MLEGGILLCYKAGYIPANQIHFNDILNSRSTLGFTVGIRDTIATFSQFVDPVIKSTCMDTLFLALLIIGKLTLTAFHDEFNLLIFSYNSLLHNDWLL